MGHLNRYSTAIFILLLPPMMMLLVKAIPLAILPKTDVNATSAWCFVKTFDYFDLDGKLVSDGSNGPRGCNTVRPLVEKKKQAAQDDKKNKKPNETSGENQSNTQTPASNESARDTSSPDDKVARGRGQTLAQFRPIEIKARLDFATASAVMQAAAAGALIFALFQLIAGWRALVVAPTPQPLPESAIDGDRLFFAITVVLAIVIAIWLAYHDTRSNDFDNMLMTRLFEIGAWPNYQIFATDAFGLGSASVAKKILGDVAFLPYSMIVFMNLLTTYLAGGLLLIYLATLAIPSDALGTKKDRMTGLQIAVVLGSIIFTLSAVANRAAAAWATVGIDEASGKALIDLANAVPKMWDVASSVFLIAAIAVGYFGIRASKAPAATKEAGNETKDGILNMRTVEGDDFKALGWLVQILLALAPIWAPASLSKIFDAAKTIQ